MIPGNANPLLLASAAAEAAAAGPIKSLRFNSGDSAHLHRTPSSAGNRKTWTFAAWIKLSDAGTSDRQVFSCRVSGYAQIQIGISGAARIGFSEFGIFDLRTERLMRDTGAWFHLCCVFDSSNSTEGDRARIYVNGVRETDFSTETYPSQNAEASWNRTERHNIGSLQPSYANYFDGYMADIYFIDGSALDPTSFGAFDSNGVWQAAAYSGTFGTNGFHLLDFANESTVGHDSSGNENDFTANNISASALATGTVSGSGTPANASGSGGWAQAFDGSTSTLIYNSNGSTTTTFTLTDPIAWTSKIRIYAGQNGTSGTNISANGVNLSALVTWPLAGGWQEVTTHLTSPLTSLALTSVGGQSSNIRAVEIDDTVIVQGDAEDIDVLFDVPTNGTQSDTGAGGEVSGNYATLNPLNIHSSSNDTISNGNLECSMSGGSAGLQPSTIAISSGKFYYEVVFSSNASNSVAGIRATDSRNFDDTRLYHGSGQKYRDGSADDNYGASFTEGDVIGVAVDKDNNLLSFYKNGVSQGTSHNLGNFDSVTTIQGMVAGTTGGYTVNFGQRAFAYSAPSGFSPLCTTLLPTPTIAQSTNYFDIKTYTGNGGTQTISGYDFSPDFVWLKNRAGGTSSTIWHVAADTVRGNNAVFPNDKNAEISGYVNGFTSDGFGVQVSPNDTANTSGNGYVAWAWNAGANSNKTYAVTVVSDSGNKYRFDGHGTSAVTLDLEEGSTYVFDQSDSSNSGHPLRFSTTSDGTHGGGSEHTTGVTVTGTPGSAGAKTTITIAASTPTLYYYCTNHSGMGGQANTNSTAGASNFDGTMQATVKANATAGFSIATWTSAGAGSVAHGLSAAPGCIFIKRRSGNASWGVYHSAIGGTQYVRLNRVEAAATSNAFFNDTDPTNSVFSVGSNASVGSGGSTYVAYCFAPVEGFSKFSSFEANGAVDGPFVYTGFRPALIIFRNKNDSENWLMLDSTRDPFNPVDTHLHPNLPNGDSDASPPWADFLSNGFKLRNLYNETNGSGDTILYMAWAENPFQANGGLAR